MKILKIIAVVFTAVLLALAGIVAYVAATFDAARIKQEIAAAVEKETGRTLKIEGELSLGFWPEVAIKVGRSTLSERGGAPEFARIESARVAVATLPLLSRQAVVKEVEIAGLKATVVKRKDGTLNIADLTGGKEKPEKVGAGDTAVALPASIDIAAIRLVDAELGWRDEAAGQSAALAASLGLEGIRADAAALRVAKFSLDTQVRADRTKIVVKLATPVDVDLGKRTLALAALDGRVDVASPALPMQTLALPLSGSVQADLAKQNAKIALATKLDASNIRAQFDIGAFAPLALVFDLDIDQIDLDKYLPRDKQDKGDGAIDLSALEGLNLKGTVKIGQLKAARIKAGDVRLKIDARGGRLDIAPLSANLYEGRIEGALSAQAAGNRIAVRQTLNGVQVGPLLRDALDQDMLSGRGDVTLDVAGQGATVGALKKSLAGTARVELQDGAIQGIDIGQKLRDAKSLFSGGKDVDVAGDATRKTDFSALSASFRIANGVARNDDLNAKSPLLRLAGAGDIDIGNHRIDYLLKTSLVATSKGQGGRERDEVAGVTLPVRLTGPLDQPAWKLEIAGLAGEAVKAKTAEIKQKAEDKLKGKLKGLFGG
jgi:AsmA protein